MLDIMNDIHKTMVYQDRYKYILEGLGNTIIMALFAVIIGTIFGILIALVQDNYEKNGRFSILNYIGKLHFTQA